MEFYVSFVNYMRKIDIINNVQTYKVILIFSKKLD